MERDLICIVCPNGCHLHVDGNFNVTGNLCPRGAAYGKQEVTNPTRIVTSTVCFNSECFRVLSVKTSKPIPKGKIYEAMKEIDALKVSAPVHIGQVLIHGIAGSDADLVATREVLK